MVKNSLICDKQQVDDKIVGLLFIYTRTVPNGAIGKNPRIYLDSVLGDDF